MEGARQQCLPSNAVAKDDMTLLRVLSRYKVRGKQVWLHSRGSSALQQIHAAVKSSVQPGDQLAAQRFLVQPSQAAMHP
jgi:hypothetical protein